MPLNQHQAKEKYRDELSDIIKTGLRELLEKKHLYQSVTVEQGNLLDDVMSATAENEKEQCKNKITPLLSDIWYPLKSHQSQQQKQAEINGWSGIYFETPDVSLYCHVCKRVEAHNSRITLDLFDTNLNWNSERQKNITGEVVQDFVCTFLCQRCKNIPESFIVRRKECKLTLAGRSMIEHLEIPDFLPKAQKKYFSWAILAYQSGQTLAANFLLRTFIEQWERYYTLNHDYAGKNLDPIHDGYMNELPDHFRSEFPSLPNIYSNLCADIHAAKGSIKVFEESRNSIVKHFDARRVSELPSAWTVEEENDVVQEYKAGTSVVDLAIRQRRPTSAVISHLEKRGVLKEKKQS